MHVASPGLRATVCDFTSATTTVYTAASSSVLKTAHSIRITPVFWLLHTLNAYVCPSVCILSTKTVVWSTTKMGRSSNNNGNPVTASEWLGNVWEQVDRKYPKPWHKPLAEKFGVNEVGRCNGWHVKLSSAAVHTKNVGYPRPTYGGIQ